MQCNRTDQLSHLVRNAAWRHTRCPLDVASVACVRAAPSGSRSRARIGYRYGIPRSQLSVVTRRRADIADSLRQRLLSGLHLGELKHGQRLPSARDLAREMAADPRVILAAYRVLAQEGLVELRPRSGIFLIASESSENGLQRRTHDWVVELLLGAVERGIPAPEFPERLRRSLETLHLRVACIECNVDQIDELSHELYTTYGFDVSGVDVYEMLDSARLPKEVRRADLLVTTHFHAHEVQPIATQLGKPLIVAELLIDGFADVARRLAEGPVYYVVVDPRFAKKLGKIFAAAPGSANLRILVQGRDDLDQIPAAVPTYLTRLVRERLPARSPLTPPLPPARVLSPETSRMLFTFIVRANSAALTEP